MQKQQSSVETQDKKLPITIPDYSLACDPKHVLKKAQEEVKAVEKGHEISYDANSNFVKALSLKEFDNGVFISTAVGEVYQTMAIDLMRKFQEEYQCVTASEKSLCELAAINYIRTLELQTKINRQHINPKNGLNKTDLLYFSLLGKELDRANRNYLSTIQVLRTLRQPTMQVNAATAIIGQNQLVQVNN